ncbi:MAG: hypothetical protein OES09_07200, partial [Gammaproteobacteria bacterium]|nr:hypothetical protein [Gammaproteobacteria bacterium]
CSLRHEDRAETPTVRPNRQRQLQLVTDPRVHDCLSGDHYGIFVKNKEPVRQTMGGDMGCHSSTHRAEDNSAKEPRLE